MGEPPFRLYLVKDIRERLLKEVCAHCALFVGILVNISFLSVCLSIEFDGEFIRSRGSPQPQCI